MEIDISKAGVKLINRIRKKSKSILDNLILNTFNSKGENIENALSYKGIAYKDLEIAIGDELFLSFSCDEYDYSAVISRKGVSISIDKNDRNDLNEHSASLELKLASYDSEYKLLLDIISRLLAFKDRINSPEYINSLHIKDERLIEKKLKIQVVLNMLGFILGLALAALPILLIFMDRDANAVIKITFGILGIIILTITLFLIKYIVFYLRLYTKFRHDIKKEGNAKTKVGVPIGCRLLDRYKLFYGEGYSLIELSFKDVVLYYVPPKRLVIASHTKGELESYILKGRLQLTYYSNSGIIDFERSNINKIVFSRIDDYLNLRWFLK